jgi:DNA-directed RNA polymerase specialized sigma24 family protein
MAPREVAPKLDAALAKLAERDPVKARLVELCYFTGPTGEAAAKILGISARTADRYWTNARAWLRREREGATPEEKEEKTAGADDALSSL